MFHENLIQPIVMFLIWWADRVTNGEEIVAGKGDCGFAKQQLLEENSGRKNRIFAQSIFRQMDLSSSKSLVSVIETGRHRILGDIKNGKYWVLWLKLEGAEHWNRRNIQHNSKWSMEWYCVNYREIFCQIGNGTFSFFFKRYLARPTPLPLAWERNHPISFFVLKVYTYWVFP